MAETSSGTIRVELITPEGSLFADEARMVVVPGAAGELAVMARHISLTARLKPGETRIQHSGDNWVSFATSEGFFTVGSDLAVVLVEDAQEATAIDAAAAQAELEAAQGRLAEVEAGGEDVAEHDLETAQRDVLYAESKLKVVGKR